MPSRKVRVACIQYQLRAIDAFKWFADQVEFFVESAADYGAKFVLLPELFTTQLMSFLPEREPAAAIRHLAEYTPQIQELLGGLAARHGIYLVGGSHPVLEDGRLYNASFLFCPDGSWRRQDKIHLTPDEREYWRMHPGQGLYVFRTRYGCVAITICYDVEFPELVRRLCEEGAELIFVPYCTSERQGFLRVRYCSHARAIENQVFVATAGTVGNLPRVRYMAANYGSAAILTPSDFPFARDGIAAEGTINQEMVIVADVDLALLEASRADGETVRPFVDRRPEFYRNAVRQIEA